MTGHDKVKKISEPLRDYFAPKALGPVYQEVVRVPQFRRTARATDEYLARLDLLRRGPESNVQVLGGLSGSFCVGAMFAGRGPSRPG